MTIHAVLNYHNLSYACPLSCFSHLSFSFQSLQEFSKQLRGWDFPTSSFPLQPLPFFVTQANLKNFLPSHFSEFVVQCHYELIVADFFCSCLLITGQGGITLAISKRTATLMNIAEKVPEWDSPSRCILFSDGDGRRRMMFKQLLFTSRVKGYKKVIQKKSRALKTSSFMAPTENSTHGADFFGQAFPRREPIRSPRELLVQAGRNKLPA